MSGCFACLAALRLRVKGVRGGLHGQGLGHLLKQDAFISFQFEADAESLRRPLPPYRPQHLRNLMGKGGVVGLSFELEEGSSSLCRKADFVQPLMLMAGKGLHPGKCWFGV